MTQFSLNNMLKRGLKHHHFQKKRNGQWWKDHMVAYEVLKTLIVTGFIIPVIRWIIQECCCMHKCRIVGTCAGELFSDEPEVVPAEMVSKC